MAHCLSKERKHFWHQVCTLVKNFAFLMPWPLKFFSVYNYPILKRIIVNAFYPLFYKLAINLLKINCICNWFETISCTYLEIHLDKQKKLISSHTWYNVTLMVKNYSILAYFISMVCYFLPRLDHCQKCYVQPVRSFISQKHFIQASFV